MKPWLSTGKRGKSTGAPLQRRESRTGEAVVILDVDQFASIRRRHGSWAGEQVTHAVADCLRGRLRAGDRLALLRDDEFLAVLPGAAEPALDPIANRLREAVNGLRLALAGQVWTLSCTIGAAARGGPARSLEGLVRAADTALHRAREAGVSVR